MHHENLPDNAGLQWPEDWKYAYDLVLDAAKCGNSSDNDKMHARVIGFLMIKLHKYKRLLGAVAHIACEVNSTQGKDDTLAALYQLGLLYRERLIRTCACSVCLIPGSCSHVV